MGKTRIGRASVTLALVHGPGKTTVSAVTGNLNGLVVGVQGVPPAAVDGGANVTVTITDSDGLDQYTSGNLTVGAATYGSNLMAGSNQFAVDGPLTIKSTYTVAQTATDSTTTVILLIDRGA